MALSRRGNLLNRYHKYVQTKTGLVVSTKNASKLISIISDGISRILAREGYIDLKTLGTIEYTVLAQKEVRFEQGLPALIPTKTRFSWSPSPELRQRLESKQEKKFAFKEEDLTEIYAYLKSLSLKQVVDEKQGSNDSKEDESIKHEVSSTSNPPVPPDLD